MDAIKLVALDEEDLRILSAHAQDSVMRVGDLDFQPSHKRFLVPMNRFVWEGKRGIFSRLHNERHRAVLHFDRVVSMKAAGISRGKPDEILSLLAIRFEPADAPAGTIELIFAGNAAIRLEAECIEARLTDLGAAWEASSRPVHD
ncbi:MAG: DUF2948 family protein [Rhizobiaceae bacterium]